MGALGRPARSRGRGGKFPDRSSDRALKRHHVTTLGIQNFRNEQCVEKIR